MAAVHREVPFMISKVWLITLIIISFTNLSLSAKKKEQSLGDRVKQLTEWSYKRPVINMNGEKYTMIGFSCFCRLGFQAEQIAKWVAERTDVTMCIRDSFSALKATSAPSIIHFPVKGKPKKADTFDMQRLGFQAEQIAKWVAERTDVTIRIFRPPNHAGILLLGLALTTIAGLLYFRRNNLEFLYNKNMWAILALVVVFSMMSGQMWNHIRGPPFAHRNPQSGQVNYIHGSSQGQFQAETYIIFVLYAALTVGMVLLSKDNIIETNGSQKRVMTIVGLFMIVFFFSLILSIFRSKYRGYPYSFLLR
ncbi:tumor suppressor candidate 3-like [Anneissia japonica]|uniref:tumor suppressor candidate 3-like n=1 Tax=Anneissia japonica TaxID=1529436 RepID=UPI0014259D46|nr:tumor suppressor candidate 3-like [Anneissia japonica]